MSSIWDFITYFKWLLNFFVVALPHAVLSLAGLALTAWFQIKPNKWWAGGNLLLIA